MARIFTTSLAVFCVHVRASARGEWAQSNGWASWSSWSTNDFWGGDHGSWNGANYHWTSNGWNSNYGRTGDNEDWSPPYVTTPSVATSQEDHDPWHVTPESDPWYGAPGPTSRPSARVSSRNPNPFGRSSRHRISQDQPLASADDSRPAYFYNDFFFFESVTEL